jgi:hypothetical protein
VQVSTSNVVSPGQYIMYRCQSAANPIRIGVTAIQSGWQWAYIFSNDANLTPPAFSSLAWNTTGLGDSSASGSVGQAYFFLSPLAASLPGATGSVTVDIKRPNGTVQYTSVLSTVRMVTTADFRLACTPASSVVSVPGTQQVTCDLSSPSIASGAVVNASIPSVVAPAGWTASSPEPASGAVSLASAFRFTVTFTSSCAASTSAQTQSFVTYLTFRGTPVVGPTSSVTIARSTVTTATPTIGAMALAWTRPYSLAPYAVNGGALTYSVQVTGCGGWNVSVSASPFVYSGTSVATNIPASNLTLTSSTKPDAPGFTTPVTSGPLGAAVKVLSVSPNNGVGSYSQTLNVNLSIPAGAAIGAYRSTVTITVAVGP